MEPTRKGIQLPLLGGKDIFIPSVPRLEDAQSVDSRSLDTAGMLSFLTPNQSSSKVHPHKESPAIKQTKTGKVILNVLPTSVDRENGSEMYVKSSSVNFPFLEGVMQPVHRPSGELSVSVASTQSESGAVRKNYTLRESNNSLWGGVGDNTLEAVEEHFRLEALASQVRLEQERKDHVRQQEELDLAQSVEESPPEDALAFLNFRHWEDNMDNESENSDFVIGLRDSLTNLAASKAREKLRNLAKYISGHTNRKVLSCWNMIASRFKQSSVFKVELTPDHQGLMHPVRHNALPTSALIKILCSSRVRVGYGEVEVMLERIGVQEKDVELGLRIAALNAVVQVCSEGNAAMAATYRDEMLQLLNQEKSLVSIDELRKEIFSSDPIEMELQLAEIKSRKQLEVAAMLAEKRKKDDMKLKQELSRKKMIDDFEKVLDQLQVMKRVFNRVCADNFLHAVDFSRKTVAQYFGDLSSNIPPDLVFFLGLQHFPGDIQEKISSRVKRYQRETQQRVLEGGVLRTMSRANSNISFHSENRNDSGTLSPAVLSRADSQYGDGKDKTLGLLLDYEDFVDCRVESVSRVKLGGNPSVLSSLRALVALGKTFPRLSYRDVVEIMQYVAATKIAAYFRCHRTRWRYVSARNKWRNIYRSLRQKYYCCWKDIVRRRSVIRNNCFRKLVAWRYYTKRCHQRREIFRGCFWSFYIWRKFACASATAKEKARFLIGRVMPTLATLQVFRAWKDYSLREVELKKRSDRFRRNILAVNCIRAINFWKSWAYQRRKIRQSWFRRAKVMRQRNLSLVLKNRFYIWRMFSFFRSHMRSRVSLASWIFRKLVFAQAPLWKRLSYTEKRLHRASKRRHLDTLANASQPRRKPNRGKPGRASKSSTNSRGGPKASVLEADASSVTSEGNLSTSILKPDFDWTCDMHRWWDYDSDGEDCEDIPTLLCSHYDDAISTFEDTSDVALRLLPSKIDNMVVDKMGGILDAHKYREQWNIFDGALRAHKYAYLAFKNLRVHAVISSRVKKFCTNRRTKTLKLLWIAWVNYTKVGGGPLRNGEEGVTATDGEVLFYQVRTHLSSKLLRTRKLVAEISKWYNKDVDYDSEDCDEKNARQMKNLNLISEENDEDYALVEAEMNRARQRNAEIKKKKERMMLIYGDFQPPNLNDLDEKDRRKELTLAENMLKYASSVTQYLGTVTLDADTKNSSAASKRKLINDMVDEVLTLESGATERAISRQQHYAMRFKEHAAEKLVNVLVKVYKEVQKKLVQDESKVYFRGLRLPMLIARSKRMMARKKLKNYIRICKRLISIDRNAAYFNKSRTLWVTFNRWLKYMSVSKLDPTPGLAEIIDRKLQLHPDFHDHLQNEGYRGAAYWHDDEFRRALSDFRVLFSRWKMFTQEKVVFRILRERVRRIYHLKLLRKCIWAMKTGLHCSEYSRRIEHEPSSFAIVRLQADVDQIIKRFLPMRRKQLPSVIRKMNRKAINKIKTMGRKAETFKSFIALFLNQVAMRVSTEQRLLYEAFEARGTQEFVDVLAPTKHHSIIPSIMTKLDGKPFYDPHVNPKDSADPTIPAGFRLTRIKWALQVTASSNANASSAAVLLGWQIVWSADGAPEVESAHRGQWHNAGISIQESIIPKDDFLIGIEYLYDGPSIVGVRLKLFFGGFTKWIGGKTSMSTLSVYLGADQQDLSPTLDFENLRRQDNDELAKPALPYYVVIGLSGLLHNNRTTNIGLVVRKIKKQNIFSYFWVEDVLERLRLQKTEQGGFTTANGIDAHSVPSSLQAGASNVVGDESLTIDDESLTMNPKGEDNRDVEEEEIDDEKEGSTSLEEESAGEQDSQELLSSGAAERRANRMLVPRIAKKFAKWMAHDDLGMESLTSAETQFFDILRMRMTELSSAKTRADEFARRIWTSRDIRTHPQLSKLVSLRVVAQLTRWFFNSISRRLIPFCSSEKHGLYLFKTSRRLENRAKVLLRRARNNRVQATHLETCRHSWDGKPVLGPNERAAKRQLYLQVSELRSIASKLENEAEIVMQEAKKNEDMGLALLPRISLNTVVYNNFKTKIAAARHKESLLERMSLDQIKHGLFGSNMKETLLNKDQMQAIHASLRDRIIVMKDTSSLQRLVDDVISSEKVLASKETVTNRFTASSYPKKIIREKQPPRSISRTANVVRRFSNSRTVHRMGVLPSKPSQSDSSVLNSLSYDDENDRHHREG